VITFIIIFFKKEKQNKLKNRSEKVMFENFFSPVKFYVSKTKPKEQEINSINKNKYFD
jgi:hypothetical protein